tara:strand:- start:143 stop:838 length:696 start_codon:yes stop_codon:yes gene_type:complete
MKDLYKKFNVDNSENQVCMYPDGQPLFREKYGNNRIGGTCNYQFRDGALKSPFEHLCLYEHHYQQLFNNKIESEYLYMSIPNQVIVDYMYKTNNDWSMEIPRKFISQINDWNDLKEIETKIDEFDKKYPNWNHDFPILGFKSVLQNGLLFPNTNFHLNKFLVAGTHRLFMCGMSGNDYPMLLQIPKEQKQFKVKSVGGIFKNNTHLIMNINLDKKQYELFLDDKKIGEVKV